MLHEIFVGDITCVIIFLVIKTQNQEVTIICGLFVIINRHKRQLDKRAFITLGCANDARGGDACGIMIDGKVDRGTDKGDLLFQSWYHKSKLLTKTEKCYVAFGHCRKASVGGVTADKAQPIVINDDKGKMLFCLIHNGTIYNYEELAKKYIPNIDIKDMSDSQVMAQIFFHKGYDVLGEYRGAGAFIIQDYRINKTLLFRGESKGSQTATKVDSERPLYLVKTGKSVIFSSIYSVLQGLYWGFDVYDTPSNTLLECDGRDLFVVKEYDRSNCYHCKPVTTYANLYAKWDNDLSYNYNYNYSTPKVAFDVKLGRYYNFATGQDLNGVQHISPLGYIGQYATNYNSMYYFWKGIMLSGENAYNAIKDAQEDKMSEFGLLLLAKELSCNPVIIGDKYYVFDALGKQVPFAEEYTFPLTTESIMCDEYGVVEISCTSDKIEPCNPVNLPKETIEKIVKYVKDCIQRNLPKLGAN